MVWSTAASRPCSSVSRPSASCADSASSSPSRRSAGPSIVVYGPGEGRRRRRGVAQAVDEARSRPAFVGSAGAPASVSGLGTSVTGTPADLLERRGDVPEAARPVPAPRRTPPRACPPAWWPAMDATCQSQATWRRVGDGAAPAGGRPDRDELGHEAAERRRRTPGRAARSPPGTPPAGPEPGIVRRIRFGSRGAAGSWSGRVKMRSVPTTGRPATGAATDVTVEPRRSPLIVRSNAMRLDTLLWTTALTSSAAPGSAWIPSRSCTSSPRLDHAGWPWSTTRPVGARRATCRWRGRDRGAPRGRAPSAASAAARSHRARLITHSPLGSSRNPQERYSASAATLSSWVLTTASWARWRRSQRRASATSERPDAGPLRLGIDADPLEVSAPVGPAGDGVAEQPVRGLDHAEPGGRGGVERLLEAVAVEPPERAERPGGRGRGRRRGPRRARAGSRGRPVGMSARSCASRCSRSWTEKPASTNGSASAGARALVRTRWYPRPRRVRRQRSRTSADGGRWAPTARYATSRSPRQEPSRAQPPGQRSVSSGIAGSAYAAAARWGSSTGGGRRPEPTGDEGPRAGRPEGGGYRATVLLLATDSRFAEHDTGPGHPERAARLQAVDAGLVIADLGSDLVTLARREATRAELERVHPAGAPRRARGRLRPARPLRRRHPGVGRLVDGCAHRGRGRARRRRRPRDRRRDAARSSRSVRRVTTPARPRRWGSAW